jgi:HD-like signal output (HDOD) protein
MTANQPNGSELLKIFESPRALPALPGTVLRLMEIMDSDEPSTGRLESIIATDPGLTSRVLRLANSSSGAFDSKATSIRGAILRVGLDSMRTLAISMLVAESPRSLTLHPLFDLDRFARHSLFVGLMGRCLFQWKQRQAPSADVCSPEEVLAAGVLHDIALPLLASQGPNVYQRIHQHAMRSQLSLADAFQAIHGVRLGQLTASACETWGLPPVLGRVLRFMEEPAMAQSRDVLPAECLRLANHLANARGYSISQYASGAPEWTGLSRSTQIGLDEQEMMTAAVERHVRELMDEDSPSAPEEEVAA